MRLLSWLHTRTTGRPHTRTSARKPAGRFRPQLEALEDRTVPSTLKVTNNYDNGPGSLRYEIVQATSKDTVVFSNLLDGQTIMLTSGELVISKSLTIKGPGAYKLTITSQPSNGSRIFEVDGAGTTVTISGLTLSDGGGTHYAGIYSFAYDGYGGAILNFGTLTISSCTLGGSTLAANYAYNGGGAIANFGTMTVESCDVSGNRTSGGLAGGAGGGIYNAGTLTVSGGDVSNNNFTLYGGGIYNAGTATVSGCTLSGNVAAYGGGIYNAGTLTVSNSMFSSNSPDNIFGPYTDGGGNTFS